MNKDLIAIFEYLEREKGIKREIVIMQLKNRYKLLLAKASAAPLMSLSTFIPKPEISKFIVKKKLSKKLKFLHKKFLLKMLVKSILNAKLANLLMLIATPKDFGRIAAQKARQIITQKLRGAERDVIYEEYRHRINELISGTVKRFVRGANLIVDLR